MPEPSPLERLETLRATLDARAAGWWRLEGSRMIQVAFAAAADMPEEVSVGFAEATRAVPLSDVSLGIVKAAVEGRPAVSLTDKLPSEVGSGLWLRRFGAERSVAVPVAGPGGRVVAVV